ncbi:GNAT family N-acetyltransferase [Piscinibacter aquaticus]|uniref:GNAT family N-acetyltransferase n=1 Tax=Piscinibacter aquaticus TaxID=392597 RepID=A0A5C6TN19_9BURK|nr:GNAT family N-acetyltransferase [Piscinibacter aquaticus]
MEPDDARRGACLHRRGGRGAHAGRRHRHQLAIAERGSDLLLGDIGLCGRENGEVELGFTLMHAAQGRGIATEALRALVQALFRFPQVRCVVAETDERNRASIRVLERLGMTLVERREAVFKNEPCVELRYRLAR